MREVHGEERNGANCRGVALSVISREKLKLGGIAKHHEPVSYLSLQKSSAWHEAAILKSKALKRSLLSAARLRNRYRRLYLYINSYRRLKNRIRE